MLKISLAILLSFFTCSAIAQNGRDTFHIYFDLNVPTLNKNAEKKIDLLIYNDRIINGSDIMVIGYADFLGSEGYNKNLSMQRAKNIRAYLVKYGINEPDVKLCVGKGEIERKDMTDKEGSPIDRRVDIVVNNRVPHSEMAFRSKKNDKPINGEHTKPTGKTLNTKLVSSADSINKRKERDLTELNKLKAGQIIRLKNVHFPLGSHVMLPSSYETIEQLYVILKENPNIRISIEGHVCCLTDPEDKDATDIDTNEPLLSLNRARAIFNYLVEKGIDPARLKFAGYGKRYPIVAYERTEEDAAQNRRVEIRVIGN